ncbi:MAG: hypothetical protein Q8L24_00525 [bacterium]|nr:hypothetical protein [bacterium]
MGPESLNLEKEPPKSVEKELRYNSPEIEDIEPAFISLIKKLREEIKSGEYDTLISDEVGGRIPTLALRKVFESKNPKNKLKTFFVAAGRGGLDEEALQTFFKKIAPEVKKALVVTEFVNTGESMANLAWQLERGGLKNFDVATVLATVDKWAEPTSTWIRSGKMTIADDPGIVEHKFFYGDRKLNAPELYSAGSRLGGVEKMRDYPTGDSSEEDSVITGAHPVRFKDIKGFDSKENQEEIKKEIQMAREDVKILAEKALQEAGK